MSEISSSCVLFSLMPPAYASEREREKESYYFAPCVCVRILFFFAWMKERRKAKNKKQDTAQHTNCVPRESPCSRVLACRIFSISISFIF